MVMKFLKKEGAGNALDFKKAPPKDLKRETPLAKDFAELEIRAVSFFGDGDLQHKKIGRGTGNDAKGMNVFHDPAQKMPREGILKDITIAIEKGTRLSLLGPSGCGKTTLLRIIAGLEQSFEGDIRFRGVSMVGVASHLRNFGMMFQDYALFPHRRVFSNIAFGLEMKKVSKMAIRHRVDEMLELVNLEGYADREIQSLSGGERQRVALARTLAPSPHLIMLDEPLGALDRLLRERLLTDLCAILDKTGITTILVTHDHQEAFAVSDLVCVMMQGRVAQIDAPQNLFRSPKTKAVADFLGFQNMVTAHQQGDGVFRVPCLSSLEHSVFLLAPPDADGYASHSHVAIHGHEDSKQCNADDSSAMPLGSAKDDGVSLLLMPDAAELISENEFKNQRTNIFKGHVKDLFFQGATWKITVQVSQTLLSFYFHRTASIPQKNDLIYIRLHPSGVVHLNEETVD